MIGTEYCQRRWGLLRLTQRAAHGLGVHSRQTLGRQQTVIAQWIRADAAGVGQRGAYPLSAELFNATLPIPQASGGVGLFLPAHRLNHLLRQVCRPGEIVFQVVVPYQVPGRVLRHVAPYKGHDFLEKFVRLPMLALLAKELRLPSISVVHVAVFWCDDAHGSKPRQCA